MKYKYWEGTEGCSDSKWILCIKQDEDMVERIENCINKIKEVEKKKSTIEIDIKNLDNEHVAGETEDVKIGQKRSKLINERLVYNNEIRENKAELLKLEEIQKIIKRNEKKYLEIQRLKDMYSRKENVCITIYNDKEEDGKIVTVISKVREDIRKLEDFGMYLTERCYDELDKAIEECYFNLEPFENEFVDNGVPKMTVKAFADMCYGEIEELEAGNDSKSDKIIQKEGYYYIPVKLFKQWYENSVFKRFGLSELKEALCMHGYAKHNEGRNDYTVAGMGKVIAMDAQKCGGSSNE